MAIATAGAAAAATSASDWCIQPPDTHSYFKRCSAVRKKAPAREIVRWRKKNRKKIMKKKMNIKNSTLAGTRTRGHQSHRWQGKRVKRRIPSVTLPRSLEQTNFYPPPPDITIPHTFHTVTPGVCALHRKLSDPIHASTKF